MPEADLEGGRHLRAPLQWGTKHLLRLFHVLPAGLRMYLRSFKAHEAELHELGWLVERSTIAVDIGANKGAYTYALSRAVGKHGMVVAVEPIEELSVYLRRASAQLSLPVRVEQCCLSDGSGTGTLFIPIDSGELQTGLARLNRQDPGHGDLRTVRTATLDDLLSARAKRVSFIKCDVEGHELAVFRGASRVLASDRPNLLVEIEQRHLNTPMEDHFAFFADCGYEAYYIARVRGVTELRRLGLGLRTGGRLEVSSEQREVLSSVYNFILLPLEGARGGRTADRN
jgi:FkbM family methyltransferase